jgi:hypothetical protein
VSSGTSVLVAAASSQPQNPALRLLGIVRQK